MPNMLEKNWKIKQKKKSGWKKKKMEKKKKMKDNTNTYFQWLLSLGLIHVFLSCFFVEIVLLKILLISSTWGSTVH